MWSAWCCMVMALGWRQHCWVMSFRMVLLGSLELVCSLLTENKNLCFQINKEKLWQQPVHCAPQPAATLVGCHLLRVTVALSHRWDSPVALQNTWQTVISLAINTHPLLPCVWCCTLLPRAALLFQLWGTNSCRNEYSQSTSCLQ